MKNKGFTLIELLAVIVILAIIMVIAVPQILNIIEKSRENAAKSSIDLLKAGIQTQIASGELTTNPFTKDNDNSGCYTFDFDSDTNGNVSKLEVKNKEKFTGQVKYCNGTITDTNLAFDGNSTKHVPKEEDVTINTANITVLSDQSNRSWTWVSDGVIDVGMWEGNPSGYYYNDTIKVTSKTPATLKGKVSLWYNCGSNAIYRIGFSKVADKNTDNFDKYQDLNQNFSGGAGLSEETYKNYGQDFEVTITEPGEYYVKGIYYMTSSSCSSYSRTYDISIIQ